MSESYGRKVNQAQSILAFLELEQSHGHAGRFAPVDELIGHLLTRGVQGERLVSLAWDKVKGHTFSLQGLSRGERSLINKTYNVAEQQARGAWFLPEKVNLKLGMVNLPASLREYGRYAFSIAYEERGNFLLSSGPDVTLLWCAVEPLFQTLFIPFKIRSDQNDPSSQDEQLTHWAEADTLLEALGFSVQAELAIMRYGGGWHRLDADKMIAARLRLMDAIP